MNFTRSSSETMTSFQATLVNTGFGQLVLRDSLGKVAQKWTLSNPKCVIGTGTNCNVSCQLPGIVDHHVLMVIGAKQVFIRALAAGLTRNGQNVTELVIPSSESEFNFEIAGHHFQFSRDGVSTPVAKEFVQEAAPARPLFASAYNDAPAAFATPLAPLAERAPTFDNASDTIATSTPSSLALAPSRLKFTVVRALEKNRQSNPGDSSIIDNGLSAGRPAWVEALVREALRPVEERLDDLNGPLQAIERRLRRQRAQLRKAHQQSLATTENLVSQPQFVPVLAPELIQSQAVIEQFVQKHTTQLEKVTLSVGQIVARLSDVDRQLSTTQAERQELSHQFQQSNSQIVSMQQEMLALFNGLQSQLKQPKPTEISSEARLWQTNIEAQLAELQATLLALDDIKTTLQAAVEQNRMLKGDLDVQQQKLGKLISESTQKAVADAMAQANDDSETIGQVVGDKVCDSLREQLGARFTNEIAQQLSDSLNNEFALPLTSQLTNQLSSQLTSQLSQELTQHVSQLTPAAPVAPNNDAIVQALRETLAELLAPLAGTLQSTLQQTIQQAVDQSLQQSVQQTIAPMIEAANSAQMRAVAALPQWQLPRVDLSVSEIQSPPNQVATEQPQYQPISAPAPDARSLPVAPATEEEHTYSPNQLYANPIGDSQAYDTPTDPSQGFDSQPYRPPGYDSQSYAPQNYETTGQDSQAFVPPTNSQTLDSQGYDSQALDAQTYDSQTYEAQSYDSEAQAYDSQAYDAQLSDSQAYDSQAWVPESELQAYDSQAYDPQPGFDSHAQSDSHARDHQAEQQPQSAVDSHAQELPSWWSDDPVADQPASGNFSAPGNFPSHKNIPAEPLAGDSDYLASDDMVGDADNQYSQSAFSAEQLELGSTEQASADSAYVEEAYDSVPYSELVNRRPAIDEDVRYDVQDEFPSEPSPYNNQPTEPELVPAGASDEYASEDYQEYLSENYDNIAQSEHRTQAAPVADNPTVAAAEANSGGDTDESVEDYMRRLLARMRGVSESEVTIPGTPVDKPASVVVPKDPSVAQPAPQAEADSGEQLSEAWTEPFDPDKYVPRGTAPEKNRDLNALRELANTSARSAIQVSARRRQGSAILIKSTIALVGLIAGIALVSINGARINIAFIATIASFLVAIIWGYDTITSIRPLVQANRHHSNQKRESDKAHADAKAEQANS